MINFKFNDTALMETLHKALVGSPAYVDSEIAICEDDNGGFSLIVGNSNENDCIIEINS